MKLVHANPLRDNIVILPDVERENVTAAGIVIAKREGMHESQAQLGIQGVVVALGPDCDHEQVRVGDRVLVGEFQYRDYRERGRKYLIVSEKDICGVVE